MRTEIGFALCLVLAGCAAMGTVPPAKAPAPASSKAPPPPGPSDLSANQMAGYMAEAAAWPAERVAAEVQRLRSGPLTAAERFKLAWLLAGKGARPEDLALAHDLLIDLEGAFTDPDGRQMLRLVQRLVGIELEARQEHRRALDLQSKIDRLKDLERDLHERAKTEMVK